MAKLSYFAEGKLHSLTLSTLEALQSTPPRGAQPGKRTTRGTAIESAHLSAAAASPIAKVRASGMHAMKQMQPLFHHLSESQLYVASSSKSSLSVIPTETVLIEAKSTAAVKRFQQKFGLTIVREGTFGKVLMLAPEGGIAGIQLAAKAAVGGQEMSGIESAQPNFLRVMRRVRPSAAGNQPLWNHHNDGNPGVASADVAADAAWTISRGDGSIRVAVLDEGCDTNHPALKAAVVAEKDVVDDNPHARPDGDDAHGTACAGIILSRDSKFPGLAPAVSLIAVRIAKGDGGDGWIFDDASVADAIDWSWQDGKADVLSNSWGGGPPVDSLTRAFERARTRGRGGKGSVIAIATGNENAAVSFPATLPNVLGVGASTPWDERKSPTSKDGENWWGSNSGKGLDLVAPGVWIATTDISGAAGNSTNNYVKNFNGTSSATPHVAAAAALILSVNPQLTELQVRNLLIASTDQITTKAGWQSSVGYGRLNIYKALRAARR